MLPKGFYMRPVGGKDDEQLVAPDGTVLAVLGWASPGSYVLRIKDNKVVVEEVNRSEAMGEIERIAIEYNSKQRGAGRGLLTW